LAMGSSSERGEETQRAAEVADETEAVQSPPKMHTLEPLNISSPPERAPSVR
jgi:hypothetical protein